MQSAWTEHEVATIIRHRSDELLSWDQVYAKMKDLPIDDCDAGFRVLMTIPFFETNNIILGFTQDKNIFTLNNLKTNYHLPIMPLEL